MRSRKAVFLTILMLLVTIIICMSFDLETYVIIIVSIIAGIMIASFELFNAYMKISMQEFVSKILFIESRTIIDGKVEETIYEIISEKIITSDELKAKYGEGPILKAELARFDQMEGIDGTKIAFDTMLILVKSNQGLNQFHQERGVPVPFSEQRFSGTKIFVDLKFKAYENEIPVFEVYHSLDKGLEEI